MRISYVCIENFRNFKKCEVNLGQNIVLIGENKAGKSNFITALRLILDSLQNRQLVADDFGEVLDSLLMGVQYKSLCELQTLGEKILIRSL